MCCCIPSPSLQLPLKFLASFSTSFHKKIPALWTKDCLFHIHTVLAQPKHSQPCWDTNPHVQKSKLLCLSTAMLRETESWVESRAGSCVRREQSQIHKQEMIRTGSQKEQAELRLPKPTLKHIRSRGEINTGSNTASVCPGKESAAIPKMIL